MLFHVTTSQNSHATNSRLKLAGTSLALFAGAGCALSCDVALARWMKTVGLPDFLADIVRLSEVFSHGMGVLLVVLAAVAFDARSWRIVPRLLGGAYLAGLLANATKLILFRIRPEYFDLQQSVWESFQGFSFLNATLPFERMYQSFPSGHTATATGLAIACSRLYPRASWFLIAIVCLCGLQRMESSAHFLSDVLAGAALGFAAAAFWEWPWMRSRLERWETTAKPDMV
jgi:membrane-associated phospholipid phosphatase